VERAADEAVAEEAEEEAEEEAAEVLEEAVEVAAEVAEMEAAVWIAVAEANASVPSYSRVPPRLVWLLHPEQEPALPRTAKGSVVRRAVAARYAGWLDEELSRTSDSGSGGGGGGGDGGECGADNRSGGGAEAGAVAVGTVAQTGGAYGADSLGLAALMGRTGGGGGGRLPTSAAEVAADTLQQHIKVLLLLGVLVRHLQRFSLRTCHAWAQVPADSVLVCVSNNLLQVGAAEGLSYLSGVALASRTLTWRDVRAPSMSTSYEGT